MQHKFDRRPNGDCWNDVIEKTKSEAIREFAHFLINKADISNNIHISNLPDFVAEFIGKEEKP